jgi:hypothetical protein
VGRARKSSFVVAAVLGLLLVGLLGAGCGGSKENEVRFQNASEPGPKPFTPPTDVPKDSATTVSSSSSGSGSTGGSDSAGQKRGAFTERNTVCDREKLIAQLNLDPDKRAAWAEAVGIDSDAESVGEYIRKLKPSTLTRDTQVTTHSYENGEATAYQAILKKGTAVLVDEGGKPVARCICGNPLSEPAELEDNTKCINCPPGYKPPPECGENCFREERNPPPVAGGGGTKPTIPTTPGDPIAKAKEALDKCKKDKGSLEACKTEYESTRKLCAANPLSPACDSSVCFDGVVIIGGASDGCSSYLERNDILGACLKLETAAKQQCLKNLDALQKKCAANPTTADCKVDPNIKIFHSRQKCTANPGRAECGAVLGACQKNPQFGCEQLVNKVNDLKQKCAGNPALPDCKSIPVVPPVVAKALQLKADDTQGQTDQGTDDQGSGDPGIPDQGTPDQGTGDQGTGEGGTGGSQGGAETPTETTPQP